MIAGSCALDLSNPTEAIRRFSAAVAADEAKESDYARSEAIYLMRAAEAHIRIGDLHGAVRWAQEAQRRARYGSCGSVPNELDSCTYARGACFPGDHENLVGRVKGVKYPPHEIAGVDAKQLAEPAFQSL